MIYVDRNWPIDGVIVRPNQDWFDEAEALTAQAKPDSPVTDHYKHVEVKKALEKLFHYKCAYCEGEPASQGPVEVEHYRPKGRVKENSDHPGYYWLAYTWENLLLSCTLCNQWRVDQPTWDDPVAGPAAGKADQFPLLVEGDRAMDPDSPLDREKPYLLNPCVDQDCETYFRYDIQGHIYPAESDNDRATRAKETIRLCGLERRRLREARAKFMSVFIQAVKNHEEALSRDDDASARAARKLLDLLIDLPFTGTFIFVDQNPHAFIAE